MKCWAAELSKELIVNCSKRYHIALDESVIVAVGLQDVGVRKPILQSTHLEIQWTTIDKSLPIQSYSDNT